MPFRKSIFHSEGGTKAFVRLLPFPALGSGAGVARMIQACLPANMYYKQGLLVPRLIGPTYSDPHHSHAGQGVKVALEHNSED